MSVDIYCGDAADVMKGLPDNSVDLIFADPPYAISNIRNAQNTWNGYTSHKGQWDYVDDYDGFTARWMEEALRLLRPGGTIYVSGVFGSLVPVWNVLAGTPGMVFLTHFVWIKSNPAPSLHRRMFTMANEIVLGFSKGPKWTFNYEATKQLNEGKQQPNWVRLGSPRRINTIIQKPERLLSILISASSNPGDSVLDPFIGTGTTAKVARQLGRNCIGIDIAPIALTTTMQRLRLTE